MSDQTTISWAEATWNTVYGCTKVSPGCAHCYIERTPPYRKASLRFERGHIAVQLMPERLDIPLHWGKPRRIFVNSLSDTFHEDVPLEFFEAIWSMTYRAPQHQYLFLTKRPERMRQMLGPHGIGFYASEAPVPCPQPNAWLGVTAENQHWADERIPILLDTPATVRWVSVEPCLGPVDLRRFFGGPEGEPFWDGEPHPCGRCGRGWEDGHECPGGFGPSLDWAVCGGESGKGYRPMNLDWARSLRDQCRAAGVPFFMKQAAGLRPETPTGDPGLDLVREYPA